ALVFRPGHHDARQNLVKSLEMMGLAAFNQGRWSDAGAAYGRLTVLEPDSAVFHNNAGAALRELKQPGRALEYLRRSASLNPKNPSVHYNLGSALFDAGSRDAERELQRAIELDPGYVDAHVNLALVQDRLGKLSQAERTVGRALVLSPGHGEAHANLASILREQGRLGSSLDHFRRALELRPESPTIFSSYLLARLSDPGAGSTEIVSEHRAWASRFAQTVDPGRLDRFVGRDASPERRLRMGYVSPDFRSHSVASFLEPLLAAHDRAQFEVICYSDAVADAVTQRIRDVARPDIWVETRELTHEALAERIGNDQVDVLIDLSGHTGGNRLLTFARRPAPVQVTYCGYPATTGLAAIGWRLTDAIADPEAEANTHAVERLWRLPRGFLCFRPDPEADAVAPLPAWTRGGVTFGSFNNLAKIDDDVVALWADILRDTPDSRILLKARALSDDDCGRRVRDRFAARGIDGARVEIAPYAATPRDHLALYARVDIGLDPFPYNGTTTTCEALWMGVPVVTLRGRAHAGRVGASILSRIGGDAWIADTLESYRRIAVELAGDRDTLAGIREGLRDHVAASPLVDAAVIARDIESAYRQMWRLWCEESVNHPLGAPHAGKAALAQRAG
ncbi:MAG: tetratricopeptide repeat protein, partial [Pseudomonadota bacterium]